MDKGRFGRKDRLIKERVHDTYRSREKARNGARCSECGASYLNGRWTWTEADADVLETTCPACLRIADKYPAGYIEMRGRFFKEHREEIVNLVRNVEKQERGERPLERIMNIKKQQDLTLVTTTGIHIARRIGEALNRSYQGNFSLRYEDDDQRVRVSWER